MHVADRLVSQAYNELAADIHVRGRGQDVTAVRVGISDDYEGFAHAVLLDCRCYERRMMNSMRRF